MRTAVTTARAHCRARVVHHCPCRFCPHSDAVSTCQLIKAARHVPAHCQGRLSLYLYSSAERTVIERAHRARSVDKHETGKAIGRDGEAALMRAWHTDVAGPARDTRMPYSAELSPRSSSSSSSEAGAAARATWWSKVAAARAPPRRSAPRGWGEERDTCNVVHFVAGARAPFPPPARGRSDGSGREMRVRACIGCSASAGGGWVGGVWMRCREGVGEVIGCWGGEMLGRTRLRMRLKYTFFDSCPNSASSSIRAREPDEMNCLTKWT